MTKDRYKAYSAGFEAGKEAGKLAILQELGIDLTPVNRRPYVVTDEGLVEVPDAPTQNRLILAYLKNGGAMTPKDALNLFGCLRLSARIFDLREQGWPIDMEYIQVGPKTWVGLFSMPHGAERGRPRNPAKQMELSI